MLELDLRSRTPIYEQLVNKLVELIVSGVMVPDEQLPSVRTLAAQLTINPNTIQKAYRELETRGYIYSIKGKGSFVNALNLVQDEGKVKEVLQKLEKIIAEALFLGVKPEEIIQIVENVKLQKGGQ